MSCFGGVLSSPTVHKLSGGRYGTVVARLELYTRPEPSGSQASPRIMLFSKVN